MRAPNTLKKTAIAVEGFRFDALAEGSVDGELVLFLHGFPEFADAWLDVMHPIARAGFYCVSVNQRVLFAKIPAGLNPFAISAIPKPGNKHPT